MYILSQYNNDHSMYILSAKTVDNLTCMMHAIKYKIDVLSESLLIIVTKIIDPILNNSHKSVQCMHNKGLP